MISASSHYTIFGICYNSLKSVNTVVHTWETCEVATIDRMEIKLSANCGVMVKLKTMSYWKVVSKSNFSQQGGFPQLVASYQN